MGAGPAIPQSDGWQLQGAPEQIALLRCYPHCKWASCCYIRVKSRSDVMIFRDKRLYRHTMTITVPLTIIWHLHLHLFGHRAHKHLLTPSELVIVGESKGYNDEVVSESDVGCWAAEGISLLEILRISSASFFRLISSCGT